MATTTELRIVVCGGRDFSNRECVYAMLDQYLHYKVWLMHGSCRGADLIADDYASHVAFHWVVQPYEAEWSVYGNAAGPLRNQRMLDEGKPDLVIAFPGGKGTEDMVTRARKAGVPVRIVR